MTPTNTTDLLGIADIAELVGAKPDTVAQWKHRGKLPDPDYQVGNRPVWKRGTVSRWMKRRKS